LFDHIISLENLFKAWQEFKRGKTNKIEIQQFAFNLENNIFGLHNRLVKKTWKPDPYISFYVKDPKLRHIHKASVRDRVFNQALFRILYQIFDKGFIFDSYSCREKKGTHLGVLRLKSYIRKNSQNYTKTSFALKCDVRKFFDNINHSILFNLIKNHITDPNILSLVKMLLESFETNPGVGLPLGNVTSQLFANVYLNELDQFIKHTLKVKYYVRYCDDFTILDSDRVVLQKYIQDIDTFLQKKLYLFLHPNKIVIRKCTQGIDFLGYVALPKYTTLRTKTKRRILRKIRFIKKQLNQNMITLKVFDHTMQSYLGMLMHCEGHKIKQKILKTEILSK
jgi:retron-type reverse transcriptase